MDGLDGFWLFLIVGVAAQAVDGALGMAYGVISTSVLLAFGVPPAAASASVHAAEVFTTGASALSHAAHRNIAWRVFLPLAVGGVVGGVAGAWLLTGVDGEAIRPFIVAYLAALGVYILYRGWRNSPPRHHLPGALTGPLGLIGGFGDAAGGGGWGPTVTSTVMGAGLEPRCAVGTSVAAEFFVTSAISAAFLWALLTGRWEEAGGMRQYLTAVAGLVAGGLIAAPFAGWIAKRVPPRGLTWAVGVLVLILAAYQTARIVGWL